VGIDRLSSLKNACVSSNLDRKISTLTPSPTFLVFDLFPLWVEQTRKTQDAVTAAAKITQARDNALIKMREESDAHAAVPYDRSKWTAAS